MEALSVLLILPTVLSKLYIVLGGGKGWEFRVKGKGL